MTMQNNQKLPCTREFKDVHVEELVSCTTSSIFGTYSKDGETA